LLEEVVQVVLMLLVVEELVDLEKEKVLFRFLFSSPLATTGLPVSVTSYPITVGGGGQAGSGSPGSNQVVVQIQFSTITSTGGGGF
jgi:hypothetical protein